MTLATFQQHQNELANYHVKTALDNYKAAVDALFEEKIAGKLYEIRKKEADKLAAHLKKTPSISSIFCHKYEEQDFITKITIATELLFNLHTLDKFAEIYGSQLPKVLDENRCKKSSFSLSQSGRKLAEKLLKQKELNMVDIDLLRRPIGNFITIFKHSDANEAIRLYKDEIIIDAVNISTRMNPLWKSVGSTLLLLLCAACLLIGLAFLLSPIPAIAAIGIIPLGISALPTGGGILAAGISAFAIHKKFFNFNQPIAKDVEDTVRILTDTPRLFKPASSLREESSSFAASTPARRKLSPV